MVGMRIAPALVFFVALANAQLPGTDGRVEKIAGGLQYTAGLAWSQDGRLYIADSPVGRVHQYIPGQGTTLLASDLKGPAGIALDEHGRLVICEGGARRLIRLKEGNVPETLADAFDGHKLNSPNDVVVRKDGVIFFSDPAFGSAVDARELPFYGVFRVHGKGMAAIARWDKRPNGLALSPDGKLLYIASSDERAIRVLNLDHQGNASDERVLITGIEGVPNGLCTDEKGRLYVAARQVLIYTPAGKSAGRIVVPEKPAALVFGDADRKTLYVAARTSVYRVRIPGRD